MGEIGVGGDTAHTEILDHVFDFANGVHSLVGVDTPEAEKFVGIGAAEFKDAVVVGGETVGGFAVAAGNDAQLNATAIQVGHDFGQSLGDAFCRSRWLHRWL